MNGPAWDNLLLPDDDRPIGPRHARPTTAENVLAGIHEGIRVGIDAALAADVTSTPMGVVHFQRMWRTS